ncbi:hypothetical protein AAMO2058_000120900 [Amorphochlora amoebiformis]
MVLDGDAKSLEEKLKEHKLDINSKDSFRNTPLILAAVLGRTECIKVLLINGAKIRSRNCEGWTAIDEALSYGKFENTRMLWSEMKKRSTDRARIRSVQLRQSVSMLKDLYIRIDWKFRSWVPFVSSFCPSDIVQIWKRGNTIRVQGTLIGLKSFRWLRGDIAFLFNFKRGKAFSCIIMNNVAKTYATVFTQRKKAIHKMVQNEWNLMVDKEVSEMMSFPISRRKILPGFKFKRATTGMIFTADKTGTVGEYQTRVYKLTNMEVETVSRLEHMSSEEIKSFRKHGKPITATQLTDTLREARANADKEEMKKAERQRLLGSSRREDSKDTSEGDMESEEIGDEELKRNEYQFNPHPSIEPPLEITNEKKLAYQEAERSGREYVWLGRNRVMERSSTKINPEVHMCDDFPITTPMLITLLDLVAPHHPNIDKLRKFLSVDMPEGFPIKFSMPVLPTISAHITFEDCKLGSDNVPSELFELPAGYKRTTLNHILEKEPVESD